MSALETLAGYPAAFVAQLRERFFAKTTPEPNTGCLVWVGALNEDGYGVVGIGEAEGFERRLVGAHRLAAIFARHFVSAELEVDHVCRNRWCVAEAHLEPVTKSVNNLRRVAAERLRAAA